MNAVVADVLSRPDVWRGALRAPLATPSLGSGDAALDEALRGGWPLGAVTEIYAPAPGVGEASLLLPSLRALTDQGRWVAFVAPPFPIHAPALAQAGLRLERCLVVAPAAHQRAWAAEQLLRSGAIAAVLAWIDGIDDRGLRRLQLAAEAGHALAALYRPELVAQRVSPAAVRLRVTKPGELELFKCRGTNVGPQRPERIVLGTRAAIDNVVALPSCYSAPPAGAAQAATPR
jgi:cell division inhibitor SulA/protein ImuA